VMTRYGEQAFVFQGHCSHMLFYFKDAAVNDCVITCSLHQSQFDVRDGSVVKWTEQFSGKMSDDIKLKKRLRTYPTEVRDGIVYIQWYATDADKVKVRL
jgi:3-phenylpropionate/trans-cinnamate dioxygenase ferredoxin component